MQAEERRQLIAAEVRRRGRATVTGIAAAYDVNPETVRRDLIELERRGALRRIHGGALAHDRVTVEPGVGERAAHQAEAKARIARAALAHLPEEGTVLVDAGTTTGALIDRFPGDRRLTVVTNALPLALRLATYPLVTVLVAGGRLRPRTLANVDDLAVRMLADLRVDVAFVATNGVSERGCSTPDPAEAAVKRAMVGAADRVVLLADHTKFGREHFVRFAALEDLDLIITDRGASDADLLPARVAGVAAELA
jgi:DeoR family fructose operon transcriptional repressor